MTTVDTTAGDTVANALTLMQAGETHRALEILTRRAVANDADAQYWLAWISTDRSWPNNAGPAGRV